MRLLGAFLGGYMDFNPYERLFIPTYGPYCKCYFLCEDKDDSRFVYVEVPYKGGIKVRVNRIDIRK